jgi:hypothetical protein
MTSAGKLILNRSLIRASVDAIDYVITHELCHFAPQSSWAGFLQAAGSSDARLGVAKSKLERQLA